MDIKLVATDIDGVWTDGGLYYDSQGNEQKKFNVADGAATLLLRTVNIPLCIITGKNSKMVEDRARHLKVDYLFQGIDNKCTAVKELCDKMGITLNQVAYIGDDFNDVKLLREAGFSACPANASEYIKKEAQVQLSKKGGEGAFREFIEVMLTKYNLLDSTIEKLLEKYS